jgi:hypothetical protein
MAGTQLHSPPAPILLCDVIGQDMPVAKREASKLSDRCHLCAALFRADEKLVGDGVLRVRDELLVRGKSGQAVGVYKRSGLPGVVPINDEREFARSGSLVRDILFRQVRPCWVLPQFLLPNEVEGSIFFRVLARNCPLSRERAS